MNKAIIIFLIGIVINQSANAQNNYLGFAFVGGYKSVYNEVGITVNSRIINHIDAEVGYSWGKFNGDGYSTGISYVPLNKKLQPFVGVQYSKNFGQAFNVSYNSNSTGFKTPKCEFLYGKVGLMYKLDPDEEDIVENMQALVTLTFSYRYTSYTDFKLQYIEGYYPYPDEAFLNKRIGNGYGACLSIIFLFGKPKNTGD